MERKYVLKCRILTKKHLKAKLLVIDQASVMIDIQL